MLPTDLRKSREICFNCLPPGQADRAVQLLGGLDDLELRAGPHGNSLVVSYNLLDYTLQGLENALIAQRFHLENSLLQKLRRALVYYCEEVQRANLKAPERQQKARRIFVQAYEHHLHGDHDDTPEEWREYK